MNLEKHAHVNKDVYVGDEVWIYKDVLSIKVSVCVCCRCFFYVYIRVFSPRDGVGAIFPRCVFLESNYAVSVDLSVSLSPYPYRE